MTTTIRYEDLSPAKLRRKYGNCLWGPPDQEHYSSDDIDAAIEEILDDIEPMQISAIGTLTVVAMRPVALLPSDFDIDCILDDMDERFGDPDGSAWEPSAAVVAAFDAFVAVVIKHFPVWLHEEVLRVEVDGSAWVREHRPDWMEEVKP